MDRDLQTLLGTKDDQKYKIRIIKEEKKELNLTINQRILLEQKWIQEKRATHTMCEKCKVKLADTLDHVIARNLLKCFGIDPERHYDEDNFAALCKICNLTKSNMLDFTNPKTKPLLLKYIELV